MKLDFLKLNLFQGLQNLNTGFDVANIYYFSVSDFDEILVRLETFNLGLCGIEVWLDGAFYDVLTNEDYNCDLSDRSWYRKAFEQFKSENANLQYSASYHFFT